ncbi:hypothetical protein PMAYCL1PPCAC_29002, partial [Pristionchus mayeri]
LAKRQMTNNEKKGKRESSEDSNDFESSSKSSSEQPEGSKRRTRKERLAKESKKRGQSSPEKKRKHRPKAIIWKGEKKLKVIVESIVGHRKCKRVLEGEYRFDTRLITKWRQAMDGRLHSEPGEHEFKVDEEQYKVAMGPKISNSKWLFEEELSNCQKLIEEFEKKWREESQEATVQKAINEEEKMREDAKLDEEHRRMKEELIAKGLIRPQGSSTPPLTSEISYTSDEDEEEKRAEYGRTVTEDKLQENAKRRNARSEEYQRLRRARKQMVFGTKEEEDLLMGEPSEEQLAKGAFLLYKARVREHSKNKRSSPLTDAEFRATFEQNWKKIFMILAKEEWEERRGLIIGRRKTFDRAARLGLKYEDANGYFFRYVVDFKNKVRYQEYEDG